VAPGPIVGADGPTEPEGQRLQKQQSARKRATGQQSPRELLKEELVDRRGSEKVYELRIAPRRGPFPKATTARGFVCGSTSETERQESHGQRNRKERRREAHS